MLFPNEAPTAHSLIFPVPLPLVVHHIAIRVPVLTLPPPSLYRSSLSLPPSLSPKRMGVRNIAVIAARA